MYQLTRFTALALAIGVLGCGKTDNAPAYANVSGVVTYNGNPLDKGQITFSTEGRPPSVADIVDGKYTGQAMVGSNRVTIAAYRKATKERAIPPQAQKQVKAYEAIYNSGGKNSDANDPMKEDYMPDEYGKNSKQIRVVEAGAPNKFDFNIKGK